MNEELKNEVIKDCDKLIKRIVELKEYVADGDMKWTKFQVKDVMFWQNSLVNDVLTLVGFGDFSKEA